MMGFKLQLFLALGLCLASMSMASHSEDFEARQEKMFARVIDLLRTNKTYAEAYWKHEALINETCVNKFPCGASAVRRSRKVPTSVHKLRPADIKVVAALGDSLTAGRAIHWGPLGLLTDFRGKSWSIGGDEEFSSYMSLPNILKKFNKDVYGFSRGRGNGKRHLNAAVSGDTSVDTIQQAAWLVEAMKNDKNVDFENDWKVITYFIGGNDLCDFCSAPSDYTVERYAKNVQEALDYLHENIPRAFVNLVDILHAEVIKDMANNLLCDAVHLYACKCAAFPSKEQEKVLLELREGYQKALYELSVRYDDKDDFAVVMQPFYQETYPPKLSTGKIDSSYFASDCFHYSSKGQQAAAKALWNNMIEPVGHKRLDWHPFEPLECPSKKHPYLFTNKNSKGIKSWSPTY